MAEISNFKTIESLFHSAGPDMDVVVSSRVRLARNIVGYPFPSKMNAQEEEKLRDEVTQALTDLDLNFTMIHLDNLSRIDRQILLEENLITRKLVEAKNKVIALDNHSFIVVMINAEDHLRLAAMQSGLALEESYQAVNLIDNQLEEHLQFVATYEWGYLNTSFSDLGTGLRASVLLHLPGLIADSVIDEAVSTASELGLKVKSYTGAGEVSLGGMYQLSNTAGLGGSEVEIIDALEMMVLEIVDFERQSRENMVKTGRIEIEDRVFRALGVLKHCRKISAIEAIELLSQIRLGISLGLIDNLSIEKSTALLFLCQTAHIQKILERMDDGVDNNLVDYTRAEIVREALEDK